MRTEVSVKERKRSRTLTQSPVLFDSVLGLRLTQSSALSGQHFFLRIADITIDLHTDDPEMKIQVDGGIRDFLVDETNPDVRVRAAWGNLSKGIWDLPSGALAKEKGLPSETSVKEGEKLFESGAVWQLYQGNGSYFFRFTSSPQDTIPYKIARFDHEFTSGEVHLHHPRFKPGQPVYPLEYPLDELLINNLLVRGRGVEIHGCGVMDASGHGYLFAGQSGAGKSTMARLWQKHDGITILSDDRIILRKLDGKIWMYGTPWHGDAGLACPTRAPLTTIYFLGRGQENGLMPIRRTAAAAGLFACSFPPFYSREGLDFILGFLGEVTKENPCYELRFLPTEKVIDFILKNRG
jgi:hypothetical protein